MYSLFCFNARRGGSFEWPKTLQGSQLENCVRIVWSECHKLLHHRNLFRRVFFFFFLNLPSSKNKLFSFHIHIQLPDFQYASISNWTEPYRKLSVYAHGLKKLKDLRFSQEE